MFDHVRREDPELARAIFDEIRRQNGKIELIASENFVAGRSLKLSARLQTSMPKDTRARDTMAAASKSM